MFCPHCKKEIPDDSGFCPECNIEIETGTKGKKESKKVYTHYSVVLIDPGPQERIINVLAEITGLSPDKVKRRIREVPWEIATRIPLNKAQEIKILMETNKAVVRLKGIDIWEDETGVQKNVLTASLPVKLIKKKQFFIIISVFIIITAGIIYLAAVLTSPEEDKFLGKLDPGVVEPERKPASEKTEESIPSINVNSSIPAPRYNLRDEGATPYKDEIAIRFDLPYESPVTLTVYDKSFSRIAVLLQGTLKPDSYRVRWHGVTDANIRVAPGVYIVQLSTLTGNYYHKIVWLARGK
ncbi:hypothetical protein AMJ80_11575 [bacterium SM23_31]|nr:MAG: hypothetical protein AMJ80_11575 [bacterium SM23_31]